MSERPYDIEVNLELLLEIHTDSAEEAARLGIAAGEFLLQCARWEELRVYQEIRLVDAKIDPERVHVRPIDTANG